MALIIKPYEHTFVMDDGEVIEAAVGYVELEANTEVTSAGIEEWFTHFGTKAAVLSVETTDKETPEWWVVAGETPTNLYPKDQFDDPDYVFSFHEGLMMRMMEQQHQQSNGPPEGQPFDAFICHASEDKPELVEPLAREMKRQGMWIWYDDDELEIGDDIRRSIDKGLANSRCGIVVFSPSFFDKSWPEYELDGLVNRMMRDESRLLPVWHKVDQDDVSEYSNSLAMKVAEKTEDKGITQIARNLRHAAAKYFRDDKE